MTDLLMRPNHHPPRHLSCAPLSQHEQARSIQIYPNLQDGERCHAYMKLCQSQRDEYANDSPICRSPMQHRQWILMTTAACTQPSWGMPRYGKKIRILSSQAIDL